MKIIIFFVFPCNGAPVEWNWQGKTEVLGEKPVPVPLRSPQIPHAPTPGSNPGLQGGKPATNRLSHGTAFHTPSSLPRDFTYSFPRTAFSILPFIQTSIFLDVVLVRSSLTFSLKYFVFHYYIFPLYGTRTFLCVFAPWPLSRVTWIYFTVSITHKRIGRDKSGWCTALVYVFFKLKPTGSTIQNVNVAVWSVYMILVSLCWQCIAVVFDLFCPRTPTYNFSSTLYPQSCWCIIQLIHSL
jgi:hypothetical protein